MNASFVEHLQISAFTFLVFCFLTAACQPFFFLIHCYKPLLTCTRRSTVESSLFYFFLFFFLSVALCRVHAVV